MPCSKLALAVDAGGESFATTTWGLDRRRMAREPFFAEPVPTAFSIKLGGTATAMVSEVSPEDSWEGSVAGTCSASVFLGADAVFLCRLARDGVSSVSSSRFPAGFLTELHGVAAPGVSVPPRVVTIAASATGAAVGSASMTSPEAPEIDGVWLRMRFAVSKTRANIGGCLGGLGLRLGNFSQDAKGNGIGSPNRLSVVADLR